jgi:NADH pyrophosphatase NudC (nudix superfamily)
MELGAIFLLLGMLAIVVMFVAQPFAEHWRAKVQSGHEISALLAERERALNALQELDFDSELGKVPAEEYSTQRANLLQMGADVLRRLDEIQAAQLSPAEESVNPVAVEQPVEPLSDEDLEDLIANRRAVRQQKAARFCPKCGKPILQSDRFCPSCGQAINSKQSQPQK